MCRPGVKIVSGGIFEQINEGFQDVFVAMAVGVVLVYLVMVASLGALRTPFIIVLSLPLAVVGALLALLITGRTLSLSALMGFLLLVGIVVTNAIVFLTFVEQLRERGYDVYDAIIEGGRVRLRPILMTAFHNHIRAVPARLEPNGQRNHRRGTRHGGHWRACKLDVPDADSGAGGVLDIQCVDSRAATRVSATCSAALQAPGQRRRIRGRDL